MRQQFRQRLIDCSAEKIATQPPRAGLGKPAFRRVLLEVCNLNNPEDRRLLVTREYRDRVARALVSALVTFYGGNGSAGAMV